MPAKLRIWVIFLLFSLVFVPVMVFLGGWLLAGPYEGEGGIFGLMIAIYADALTGSASAVILLLSPLLLAGIWRTSGWLRRNIKARLQTAPAG